MWGRNAPCVSPGDGDTPQLSAQDCPTCRPVSLLAGRGPLLGPLGPSACRVPAPSVVLGGLGTRWRSGCRWCQAGLVVGGSPFPSGRPQPHFSPGIPCHTGSRLGGLGLQGCPCWAWSAPSSPVLPAPLPPSLSARASCSESLPVPLYDVSLPWSPVPPQLCREPPPCVGVRLPRCWLWGLPQVSPV